jgi:PAS domain S-box-containing protein
MNNFQKMMDHSIDAMIAIDGNQRVLFWNPACESLTGISARKVKHKPCYEILRAEDPGGHLYCRQNCPLSQVAKGGPPPSNVALRIADKEGRKIQLNVDTMLMPAPKEREWMVVHVLRRGRCPASQSAATDSTVKKHIGKLSSPAPGGDSIHGLSQLSERELEVLRLVAQGQNTASIANVLHLSPTTVRNHVQRLMAKLNVHSRIEAVKYAHLHNLPWVDMNWWL